MDGTTAGAMGDTLDDTMNGRLMCYMVEEVVGILDGVICGTLNEAMTPST